MRSNLSRLSLPLGVTLLWQLLMVRRAAALVTFTYPVENGLIFYDGETINVSWTSTLENATLILYYSTTDDPTASTFIASNIGYVSSVGSVLVPVDFHITSDYCWFNLFETDNPANGVNSVTFLLSSDYHSGTTLGVEGLATTSFGATGIPTGPVTASSSATSLLSTAASTSLSLIASSSHQESSSSPSSSSASTSPSSSTTAVPNSGLSSGAKAGIGVGVSLGALAVLGALGFWLLRRRRQQRVSAGERNELSGETPKYSGRYPETAQVPGLHEMGSHQPAVELP